MAFRASAAAADSEGSDDFQDAQEDLSPQRRLDRQFSPEKEASEVEKDSIVQSEEWKSQRKHIFVLSEAGKPIFSIHGDEDDLASIMAVMQVSKITQGHIASRLFERPFPRQWYRM